MVMCLNDNMSGNGLFTRFTDRTVLVDYRNVCIVCMYRICIYNNYFLFGIGQELEQIGSAPDHRLVFNFFNLNCSVNTG